MPGGCPTCIHELRGGLQGGAGLHLREQRRQPAGAGRAAVPRRGHPGREHRSQSPKLNELDLTIICNGSDSNPLRGVSLRSLGRRGGFEVGVDLRIKFGFWIKAIN